MIPKEYQQYLHDVNLAAHGEVMDESEFSQTEATYWGATSSIPFIMCCLAVIGNGIVALSMLWFYSRSRAGARTPSIEV